MKSVAKIIKYVILVIVVLVIALCLAFYLFGEQAIKVGIETAGTKALNVGVNIDELDLSIMKGSFGLNGLIVSNPPGYQHENLLELDNGRIEVSLGELMGDPVKINSIKLDGINLTIEQKGLTNNLQEVIKSIPTSEKQPEEAKSAKEGKKLQINELEITNVKVNVKLLPVPGKADTVTLSLDPIRMTNLGSDDKLDTAKLVSKILLAITTGVAKQGAGVLPDDIVNSMQATLDKTLDAGKAAIKEGEKMLDAGKEAGKGIIEGFKGLIKPKK